MKKKLPVILILLLSLSAYAQKPVVNNLTTFDDKVIHFGFSLGLNTLDFGLTHYSRIDDNLDFTPFDPVYADEVEITGDDFVYADVVRLIPGFTVGIVTSLRLSNDFNLRFLPGLSFGERQLTYNYPVWDRELASSQDFYSIKSTFLDFPLLIKYKARRINNDRPYIVFGPAYRQDISRTGREDLVRLKNGSYYFELGAGWDHFFTFFRFSTELKFSFGLNNVLGDPPGENQRKYYTHAIRDLRSNVFTLVFHFE